MSSIYQLEATFSPADGRRGERASLKVQFNDVADNFEVDKAVVRITDFGIYDVMRRQEDGTYLWSYPIPYEAPLQTYSVEVYAIDKEGNKGPAETITYVISG
ncbi:hypothetical protein ACFSTH_16310 [Paenibacillus yanchengensis]|uniref:Ig-like domain-containing protein n=1 Tax=Paenibacillus yanchengensis TaxID=2035833 RepID=A0ABW4YH40_9BACL